MIYRGFPERLHHNVPHWVEPGALFHIRIRLDREKEQKPLTVPPLAQAIWESAKFYEARRRAYLRDLIRDVVILRDPEKLL